MKGSEQISEQMKLKNMDGSSGAQQEKWVMMEGGNEISDSVSIESLEDSANSISSISSSDLMEDASSSTSCTSSSSSSNGPLYELSELIAQLPIKRGLSKFYQGKSQSFTSLASVKNLEDLAKKGTPHRLKMKPCKSFGAGLDGHKSYGPKPTISKKSSIARGSSLLSSIGKRSTLVSGCRPSIFPLQKNF